MNPLYASLSVLLLASSSLGYSFSVVTPSVYSDEVAQFKFCTMARWFSKWRKVWPTAVALERDGVDGTLTFSLDAKSVRKSGKEGRRNCYVMSATIPETANVGVYNVVPLNRKNKKIRVKALPQIEVLEKPLPPAEDEKVAGESADVEDFLPVGDDQEVEQNDVDADFADGVEQDQTPADNSAPYDQEDDVEETADYTAPVEDASGDSFPNVTDDVDAEDFSVPSQEIDESFDETTQADDEDAVEQDDVVDVEQLVKDDLAGKFDNTPSSEAYFQESDTKEPYAEVEQVEQPVVEPSVVEEPVFGLLNRAQRQKKLQQEAAMIAYLTPKQGTATPKSAKAIERELRKAQKKYRY